ncbi:response regulator [Methylocystis bryophila]|uniref:Two-component system response regulator n=1 Tax=Methylocystis bryophila TaxID=655015 RepID=A0A1W6MT46_9HYPH|nr:response regulator transcription factor [Methylocystis bryophila]ARN80768.1 two-component system response regulator [Methylocystis bryophila]
MRILVVEDERELAGEIVGEIRRNGFVADCTETIAGASEALQLYPYPLALLDRRLPDGDAMQAIPAMRRAQPGIRVIMLSALDAVEERVRGLDAGADDYLTKPCPLVELMARIRASLRRPGGELLPPVQVGALTFDLAKRNASVQGGRIPFHARELALLDALARRAGQFVRRQALMEEIYSYDDDVQPHTLTMVISRVRQRLIDLDCGAEIVSERGVGCMLREKVS